MDAGFTWWTTVAAEAREAAARGYGPGLALGLAEEGHVRPVGPGLAREGLARPVDPGLALGPASGRSRGRGLILGTRDLGPSR